jgi:hypothetical protein
LVRPSIPSGVVMSVEKDACTPSFSSGSCDSAAAGLVASVAHTTSSHVLGLIAISSGQGSPGAF